MNGTQINIPPKEASEVMMLDLANGKTIICRVRYPTADELQELDEAVADTAVVALKPRMLQLVPTGQGRVQVVLLPYLNGETVTVYTHLVAGSSSASRMYMDQYLQDTTGIVPATQVPDMKPNLSS